MNKDTNIATLKDTTLNYLAATLFFPVLWLNPGSGTNYASALIPNYTSSPKYYLSLSTTLT
jgi:hypothetical protein